MINVLNKKEGAKEVSFLSPDWEVNSQSGKEIIDVLEDIDKNTEVLNIKPQELLVISITRRTADGIKTVAINPTEVDAEDIITSASHINEEIMLANDLRAVGVDSSTLSESFEEGHFFMCPQEDCLLIPNKGFTALIGKKLRAGKMPAGLNVSRDLYLATLMAMGSSPITIIARGDKSTGTLKAVAAFGDSYPFTKQTDMFKSLKGGLEKLFGHTLTETNWCVTHQYSSIVWAVCPCGEDMTIGVCAQWSQTGYAALQLFPVAIYTDGQIEKIAQGMSRPNTGSAVNADPNCERLVESFANIWKEIIPLRDALSRGKEIPVASFKEAVVKAAEFVTIRDGFNEKKKAKFIAAFLAVPDHPATLYDVIIHVMEAPVLMHRLFSGTYEMVPNISAAALAVAESKGVL